ncbi:uncharacterized protein LOC117640530 [Thrips palmi]|uniref:Uncharacterized protein LOC117640530 n=1 Tax=Thrips palmi TaxID=161013 RepID=A0A6P8YG63_THRPL|nr:uncharacterized protein LOC117640530 [Thrips palmi]
MRLEKPSPSWKSFPIKLRHRFATYEKARSAAKKQNEGYETVGTEPSDLDQVKRRSHRPKRYCTTSDDDDVQPKPKKRKREVNIASESESDQEAMNDDEMSAKISEYLKSSNKYPSKPSRTTTLIKKTPSVLKESGKETKGKASKGAPDKKTVHTPSGSQTSRTSSAVLQKPQGTPSCSQIPAGRLKLPGAPTNSLMMSTSMRTPITLEDHQEINNRLLGKPQNTIRTEKEQSSSVFQGAGTVKLSTTQNDPNVPSVQPSEVNTKEVEPNQNDLGTLIEERIGKIIMESNQTSMSSLVLTGSSSPQPSESSQNDLLDTNEEIVQTQHSSPLNDSGVVVDLPKSCFEKLDIKIEGYQRVTAESLSEIRQQLNAVMLNQAKILSHVAPEDELYDPTNMPPLFIKTEEKLDEFEVFLKNPTNFKSYVLHLTQLSMDIANESDATGFILKKTISNRLARGINWEGKKGKLAFEKTLLNKAICCAMLKNFPQGRLILTKAKIKRWLDTSAQRKLEESEESCVEDDD